jgi:hypothetical protein
MSGQIWEPGLIGHGGAILRHNPTSRMRRLTRTLGGLIMTFGNSSTGTLAKLSPQLLTTRGRPTKFTLERLQQIRNLVERGESREGIAEILDVTIGSLQVTCSRLSISLRRPKVDNGVRLLRQRNHISRKNAIIMQPDDHDGRVPLQPTEEQAQETSQSEPAEPALAAKQRERVQTLEAGSANIAIRIQYKGTERTIGLPLTLDEIVRLAWEAEFRGMRIGQFIGELIAAMVTKDLFRVVLDKP